MSKIAVGICGSFCNHSKVLEVLKRLSREGYELIPIISDSVNRLDTRFYKAYEFKRYVSDICKHDVLTSLVDGEKLLNVYNCKAMIILPCTATTLNKLALGIYDSPVVLGAKSLLRNDLPVVIAFASNDGLSNSLINIGKLINQKNIFFVPFKQDDYLNKPHSLVCNFDLCSETLKMAFNKEQLQPLLDRMDGMNNV